MATIDTTNKSALSRYDLSWDAWLTRAYAINWEVALYTVILVLAVVTRFWALGARVMSHDESLHTYFSWKLYAEGDFQHTPLMHGPLLFHATAFFYFLFGDSDFSARIYPALLGIFIVMMPLLFRRWLGRAGALLAALGFLISPMLTYYSRYIRHDIPAIFFALVMLYALMQYIDGKTPRRPVWLWVFSGGLALLLASKEVGFIYISIFGSFLLLYLTLRMLQETPLRHRAPGNLTWTPGLWQAILGHAMVVAAALVLGFFAGELLYLWQFASFSWIWVAVGVMLVLFVRLIPLATDLFRKALRGSASGDILHFVLAAAMMLGIVIFIVGAVIYQDNDSQLDVLDSGVTLFQPSEVGSDPLGGERNSFREGLEDDRRLGLGAAIIGAAVTLLTFGGLLATGYFLGRALVGLRSETTLERESRPPDVESALDDKAVPPEASRADAEDESMSPNAAPNQLGWLFSTLGTIGVVLFALTLLKLTTEADFGRSLIFRVAVILVFIAAFESVGFVRTVIAGERRPGVAQMLTEGLSRGKSSIMIVLAGAILGGVFATYAFGVLDIIKPAQVWLDNPALASAAPDVTNGDSGILQGEDLVDEVAPSENENLPRYIINAEQGNALILWLGVPLVIAVLLVFLIAVMQTPASMPLPWSDILTIFLGALLVGGVLLYVERRSLITESESSEPVAIDPVEDAGEVAEDDGTNRAVIVGAVAGMLSLAALVAAWRVIFPDHWEFLGRQPAFDVLIIAGTLILPWLAALPIFWAGYQLDIVPPPDDTAAIMVLVAGAFWVLSAAVGFAWNPRVWVISTLVFLALFVFFFTTVFTYGQGVFTGMINSLGYWLEQHDVRRGSQPQYYYTLIQVPVYEFMPLILAALAGISGLWHLFGWRTRSLQTEAAQPEADSPEVDQPFDAYKIETNQLDMERMIQEQPPLGDLSTFVSDEGDLGDALRWQSQRKPDWARPYNHDEELDLRANRHEWLGELPFLAFIGFWAMTMLAGLSIAGEKMPWLTTHITVPLILVGAWYAGRIIEKIDWAAIRQGGWALLLILLPVLTVAVMRVVSPIFSGDLPFSGPERDKLSATNAWLAALIVTVAVTYFLVQLARRIGVVQTRRIAFAALVILLGVITARATLLANFENYDLPTEYLVYAHSGPAVKTVMEEIEFIANRTNEGRELKVAYDDDSSWPMTWYMRDYNSSFFAGEADDLENNTSAIEGAAVVVVGNRKNAVVERVLGDEYFRFDYIRLWWPMQEYFNLNFDRVSNVFQSDDGSPVSELYRQGIWDIWWNRDYTGYAAAQCVENQQLSCQSDANPAACFQRITNECRSDDRYALNNWPVSDRMYVYVDKEIAAEIWDAGIGGVSVAERVPQSPVDRVSVELDPATSFGVTESLSGPRGLDVGPDGRVYVADTNNSRIIVYDETGSLLSIIGVPTTNTDNTLGTLFQPWGVEVSDDGMIYVADTWNHRVSVFDATGVPVTFWGEYGVPEDGENPMALWGPRDITIDLDGNILVADTGGKRVRVYSPDGEWLRDIGTGGSGLGQLDEPVGLAVNPVSGEIYVADTWNRRVQAFSSDGVAIRQFDVPMWYDNRSSPDRPYLAVSPDGALIAVSDMHATGRNDGPRVVVFDLAGNPVLAFNSPEVDFAAGLHGIRIVAGLEFAPDGSLYVADTETSRIVKFERVPAGSSLVPSPLEDSVEIPDDLDVPLVTEQADDEGESDAVEEESEAPPDEPEG